MVNLGNDLKVDRVDSQREISLIVKDIEFESKKISDLDRIIRDKSTRLSMAGGFSAKDFPIVPTDNTVNHISNFQEPKIFDNTRPDEVRLPRVIEEEFDSGQVNIRQQE